MRLQENTRAAAAPRKPKNGAVSSPLNVDDIFGSDIKRSDLNDFCVGERQMSRLIKTLVL